MTIPIIKQNFERVLAFDVHGGGDRSFSLGFKFTNYLPKAYYFKFILKDENGNIIETQEVGQINPGDSKDVSFSGSIDTTNKNHPLRTYWMLRIEAYKDDNYTQLYDYVEIGIDVLYVDIPDDPYKYKCDYDGSTEEYCPTPDGYDSNYKVYGPSSGKLFCGDNLKTYESGEAPVDPDKDIYLVAYVKGYGTTNVCLKDENTGFSTCNDKDKEWRLLAIKLKPYIKDSNLVIKYLFSAVGFFGSSYGLVDAVRIYEF